MDGIIMDEQIMKHATFREVCKLLENRKDDSMLLQCIVPVARLLTLVVPGLTFARPANLEWFGDILDKGLTLLDSSEYCRDIFKNLGNILIKEESDYVKRANNAVMAYILIVYTAFFDAAKDVVTVAGVNVDFDSYAKSDITEKACSAMQLRHLPSCEVFLDWGLTIPSPAESMGNEDANLRRLYRLMRINLESYLEGLEEIEKLDPAHKNLLFDLMNKLPDLAIEHYRALYVNLSEKYPNFAIWTRLIEHRHIEEQIDKQGRKTTEEHDQILKAVECLPQMIQERTVEQLLQRLYSSNQKMIERPLIDEFEIPLQDQIKLPPREDSFIPQKFSYLRFKDGISLSQEAGWNKGTDLIGFISHSIYNQALNKTPMLILGGPGAGKTMLSQMLAGKYLCNHYHVIVIRLRELGNDRRLYENVENQINHRLMQIKREGSWDQLLSAKLKMPILVIFDGYDELLLASNKEHELLLRRIERFQNESDLVVHTIVTSRLTMIGKIKIPEGSTVIRLDGFDEEGIEAWCAEWNKYHQDYYRCEGLTPLQIPAAENIMELAKQPLLLLMLALYDLVGNSLQKDQNLDQAQLYNKLIRRFIGREEKKTNEEFDEEYDTQEIDQEMERLGVTALGMYNRNCAHIRVEQLKRDLEFLKVKPYCSKMEDEKRLLRRFFFIHSMNQEKMEDPTFGAYEFLHNSFGEFLTAHYIASLLVGLLNGAEPGKSWYASMAYVPLYTRTNVAEMLCRLAAATSKLQRRNMECWLESELARTLRGDAVAALDEASGGFIRDDNQVPLDPLVHMSIYACNLMCLGALTMGQVKLEQLEAVIPGVWEKLVRLWQFGFGEEEMVRFSRVFRLNEAGCFVFDDCSDQRYKLNNRSGDLTKLYSNLWMEPECSLMAALNGGYSVGNSFCRMVDQRLPFDLSMAHKAALNSFAYTQWNTQSLENVYDDAVRLLEGCSVKRDKGTRAGVYMILKQYADSQNVEGKRILEKMAHTVLADLERAQTPMMRRLLTELLLLLPEHALHRLGVENILSHYSPSWPSIWEEQPAYQYHDSARMIARIVADAPQIAGGHEVCQFLELPRSLGFSILTDTIPYIVSIIEKIDLDTHCSIREPVEAIDASICALEREIGFKTNKDLSETIAGLLCIIWNRSWRNTADFRIRIWDVALIEGVTMWDIYSSRPDIVEHMCWAGMNVRQGAMTFRTQRLKELLDQCHEELSFKHYKIIRDLAKQTKDDELAEALKQIKL